MYDLISHLSRICTAGGTVRFASPSTRGDKMNGRLLNSSSGLYLALLFSTATVMLEKKQPQEPAGWTT